MPRGSPGAARWGAQDGEFAERPFWTPPRLLSRCGIGRVPSQPVGAVEWSFGISFALRRQKRRRGGMITPGNSAFARGACDLLTRSLHIE